MYKWGDFNGSRESFIETLGRLYWDFGETLLGLVGGNFPMPLADANRLPSPLADAERLRQRRQRNGPRGPLPRFWRRQRQRGFTGTLQRTFQRIWGEFVPVFPSTFLRYMRGLTSKPRVSPYGPYLDVRRGDLAVLRRASRRRSVGFILLDARQCVFPRRHELH